MLTPRDRIWGSKDSSGNWTGVVGMVSRGEADLGLSHLDITEQRTEAVDFSFPYDVADKTFATDYPQPFPRYAAFIYPFNTSMWFFIFISFIVTSCILSLLSTKKILSIKLLLEMFGSLCKQPYVVKETSYTWKIVFTLWCIFVTVITLSYSAVFFSYLTIPLIEKGITTISELSNAVEEGFYKCRIPNGTNDLHILLDSKQRELNTIGEYVISNNWFYDATNYSVEQYTEPHTAVMANRIALSTPAFYEKFVSEDSFGVWYIGIALGKSFCCKERLDRMILRILGSGLFQKYRRDELSIYASNYFPRTNQPKLDHLQFADVYGIFIPLISGYAISIIAFIGELLFFYLSNNVAHLFTM